MRLDFWRPSRPAPQYRPLSRFLTPEMLYAPPGEPPAKPPVVPELLSTFVDGFEDQVAAEVSRLARVAGQTYVAEPTRLIFRGYAHGRTWQRAWKIVSTHEVTLRVAVEMDEAHPEIVRATVNSTVAVEMPLGSPEPESSAHLSARISFFRERLLAHARLAMGGRELVAQRRAELVGHPARVDEPAAAGLETAD